MAKVRCPACKLRHRVNGREVPQLPSGFLTRCTASSCASPFVVWRGPSGLRTSAVNLHETPKEIANG